MIGSVYRFANTLLTLISASEQASAGSPLDPAAYIQYRLHTLLRLILLQEVAGVFDRAMCRA